MRHVSISASDERMDGKSSWDEPLNPLPVKCAKCKFPDLDFVPQPYFVIKSRTMSSHELALAAYGNFLVRERARRVLEQAAPGACDFYPTVFKGTSEATPWSLAVPKRQVVTAKVDPNISRCPKCGEPKSAHPGTQYKEWLFATAQSTLKPAGKPPKSDVLKSSTWASSEYGWDQWLDRKLFFSVRLLQLFNKLKVKGFYEATCAKPTAPDDAEQAWIDERLQTLGKAGVAQQPSGTISDDDAKWFRGYLKQNAREVELKPDAVKAAEKRLKAKLPKSYLEFLAKVGRVSFKGVDEQEGFDCKILPLAKLSWQSEGDDNETDAAKIGLTFATTDHGDVFCFAVQAGMKEYPVLFYKHEYDSFEPYADNFAACLRRFSEARS